MRKKKKNGVHVTGNYIRTGGAKALSKMLKVNNALKTLDLCCEKDK